MRDDAPKLRSDLEFVVREELGDVVVVDDALERYHQIGPVEHLVFREFTGDRSIAEIARRVSKKMGADVPPDAVAGLAAAAASLGLLDLVSDDTLSEAQRRQAARAFRRRLRRAGLAVREGPTRPREPERRARQEEAALLSQAIDHARAGRVSAAARAFGAVLELAPGNERAKRLLDELRQSVFTSRRQKQGLMQYRLPLFDPERLLARLDRLLGWLVRPWNGAAALIAVIVAETLLFASWSDTFREARVAWAHWRDHVPVLVALYAISPLLVALHELSHGLACRHFGGRVRRMGLLWMGVILGAYCDVTSSYLFPERWKRVAVALAGPVCDAWLVSLSIFGFLLTQPGTGLHLFLLALGITKGVSFALDFLPFYKDDFYYAIAEAFGITNLLDKALAVIKAGATRLFLGLPEAGPELEARESLVVKTYGLVNVLATALIVAKTFWIGFYALVVNLKGVGLVLFAGLFAAVVGRRLVFGLVPFLWARRAELLRQPRFWLRLGVGGAAAAAVALAPVRDDLVVDCQLVRRSAPVTARTPGELVDFAVVAGDRIEAGALVARLSNRALESDLAECRATLDAARADLALEQLAPRDVEVAPLQVARDAARTEARLEAREAARLEKLAGAGLASAAEALSAGDAARDSQMREKSSALALAEKEAGARPAEIDGKRAGVAEVAARCARLADAVAGLEIHAPAAGRVVERLGVRGEVPAGRWVQKGDEIARLSLESPPRVELELPADARYWAHAGERLEVRLLGASALSLPGSLASVLPNASGLQVEGEGEISSAPPGVPDHATCSAEIDAGRAPFLEHALRPIRPILDLDFWSLW